MAAAATEQVRNIILVGQDGAGKTSLAEAMLFAAGRTPRMGTTQDGKSYLDYDDEEIRRGFTLSTSIAPVPYKNFKINVLDASGNADFVGETIYTMAAAEAAVFVVDAEAGPQTMTTRLWRQAGNMNMVRAIVVNHIDRETATWDRALDAVVKAYGNHLCPVTIPMGEGSGFQGVIDVLRMRAMVPEGNSEKIIDIPAEYADEAEAAHEQLVEILVEADDELMMMFLEGEEISQEEIEGLVPAALEQGVLVPVFVTAVTTEKGVKALMEDIVTYFPAPEAHPAYALEGGDELAIDAAGKPCGFVFKTASDPFVGRLSYMKVLGGTLEPGTELINARTGKKERLGHLYVMMGKETTDVKTAVAGDIIVIPKLAEAKTGDTLAQGSGIAVVPPALPKPQYPVAIEASNRKEEDKLGTLLAKATETDPTLQLRHDEETHQTILTAMGETQIETLLSRMKQQNNVEAKLVPVRIPYRETIRKTAEAQGRHKKQTGGSGQFGDCWLRLSPNPGAGYEFIDEIKGGVIPNSLIPAVDKGVRDAMTEGFLAGYPMVDLKCACYYGSYHPVDSNEMAFKTAARIGFRACCEKADPAILEPICILDVDVSEDYAGTIMGDISTRRGRVIGTDVSDIPGRTIIKLRAPYAEVVAYTKDLRSMTRGDGLYNMEMDGYDYAPAETIKKLIAEYEAAKAAQ